MNWQFPFFDAFLNGVICMVKVNGNKLDVSGWNVLQLIENEGYKRTNVAVELNEEIVPKTDYETVILKDGDSVEIVSFVGGG